MPTAYMPLRRNRFFTSADGVQTFTLIEKSNEPLEIDWSDFLADNETIVASTWTGDGVKLSTLALATPKTSCVVVDGFGDVRNKVTTSLGRTPTAVVRIRNAEGGGVRDYGG